MGDFFFVAKCFVLTLAVVVCLQIKIGGSTLETHTVNWIHRSDFVHQLQDVAEGAVKAGKSGAREVAGLFEDKVDDVEVPYVSEASTGWLKIKRSDAYHKQKAREKKEERAKKRKAAESDSDFSSEDQDF